MKILAVLFFLLSPSLYAAQVTIADAYQALKAKKPVEGLTDQQLKNTVQIKGDNPDLVKAAELIAYLPRPALVKHFVQHVVKNSGSANEDLSLGMAHLLLGQPEPFLSALNALKPQKAQTEIIEKVGFGLSNLYYDDKDPQKNSSAANRKRLRDMHSKYFEPKNPHQKVMLLIEAAIVGT